MDDALPVGEMHGPGQGLDQPGRLGRGLRPAAGLAVQAAALDQFQRQEREPVVLPHRVDAHDVVVPEAGHGLGLVPEAGQFLPPRVLPSQDHLQGEQLPAVGSVSACSGRVEGTPGVAPTSVSVAGGGGVAAASSG